jgi:hypothetical protein
MNQLEELCIILNEEYPLFGENESTETFLETVLLHLGESFIHGKLDEEPHLRISSLGKPVVDQMLPILLPRYISKELPKESQMRWSQTLAVFNGHLIEAIAILTAKRLGMDIGNTQEEVEYMGVVGHIDFTIDGFVVDVKSMSPGYFNKFTKCVSDERGYITQASCYSEAMELPFAWLLYDKSRCHWHVDYLMPGHKAIALERVNRIVPKMRKCKTVTDLLKVFKAPDPVPEIYKKEETGKLLVPQSMWYSEYKDIWYQIELEINGYGKVTHYVEYKRTPEEIKKLLGVKR